MVGAGQVEAVVARWQGREGGQERATCPLFLPASCDLLGVPRPDPADATTGTDDDVFERAVRDTARDGSAINRRIDRYRRDALVLAARQSRWPRDPAAAAAGTP
ncbi:MAG: hypothetical protein GVY28_10615 [Alphaproteobacteria bacterium]|jgi:hypothetical protein|nr:hypothetical protein [Alphaproteobacteria bacterium]